MPDYRLLVLVVSLAFCALGCDALEQARDLDEDLEAADNAGFPATRLTSQAPGATRYLDAGTRPEPDSGITVERDVNNGRDDAGADAFDDVDGGIFLDVESDAADAIANQAPIAEYIYPNVVPAEGGALVTVEGARFSPRIVVQIDGEAVEYVDVIDEFTLLFRSPPLSPGPHGVKLLNPGASAVVPDALLAVEALRVDGVDPGNVSLAGGQVVRVTGAGFGPDTRFVIGDREADVLGIGDGTSADLVAPPHPVEGRVDVIAIDRDIARLAGALEYRRQPELRRLLPDRVDAAGGTPVRIDGYGLGDDCAVVLGSLTAPLERLADGGWGFVAPPGAPGVSDAALDCGARGTDVLAGALTYDADLAAGPSLVWPDAGFTRGGALISITGSGLDGVDEVRFGDAVASVVRTSDTRVDVLSPFAGAGRVDITVSTADDSWTLDDAFTFFEQPVFEGLDPASGPRAGGFEVLLRGTNLETIDALRVDQAPVAFEQTADGLRFTAPGGAAGPAPTTVEIGSLQLDPGFPLLYLDETSVDRYFPGEVAVAGGSRIVVVGSGFDDSCRVLVDGIDAATDVLAGGFLVATAPPHAEGTVPIEVSGCTEWTAPTPLRYVSTTEGVGGIGGGAIDGEVVVTVLEAGTGQPIEGATVRVGTRESDPWVALTDTRGLASFVDDELVGPQTITAYAEGRSTESYVNANAREITFLLAQLPPPPCDPTIEDCSPPPPPPTGTVIGFLTGLRKVADPPPGAYLVAYIETTRLSPGYPNPYGGPDSRMLEDGPFALTTRLGDMALIAACGWEDGETGEFTPRRFGVVRGITMREDDDPVRLAVECDIPLSEVGSYKLVDSLALSDDPNAFPGVYRATPMLNFGGEGVYQSLPDIEADEPVFYGGAFPVFEGVLEDVTIDITAGAYPLMSNVPQQVAYLRGLQSTERVWTFPGLLDVPQVVTPSPEDPRLVDGYIEWSVDPSTGTPDLYYLSVTSSDAEFSRWTVFVPGYQTAINLAEFPDFAESVGLVPGPGEAREFVNLFIRGVDLDVFDFDDFNRFSLRSRNWRASSAVNTSISLVAPVFPAE